MARTYLAQSAAFRAGEKAGIPPESRVLVQNASGRWSCMMRTPDGRIVPPPPPAPRVRAKKVVQEVKRAPQVRSQVVASKSDRRYAPWKTMVVLNQDILERCEIARLRVKPGRPVPNRSDLIRDILDRALPPAHAAR